MPLQLIDATRVVPPDKLKEISGFLLDKFRFAHQARLSQVEGDYKRWMDNYSAKPAEQVRTTPWYRASNFIPQLIRMHVDILTARMVGIIFGTKPFWKPSSVLDAVPESVIQVLQSWLEFETSGQRMNFYPPIRSGIYRGFKTGTNIFKTVWCDAATHGYAVAEPVGVSGYSPRFISREGVKLQCVPFEDFYPYPITVEDIDDVQIKFQRLRFTKQDLEWRSAQGLWDPTNTARLLQTEGDYIAQPAREAQAQEAGIELTKDVVMPFSVLEAWFSYIMPDGKRYKLVAVHNPQIDNPAEGLLRFYFNFDRRGEEPFVVQRPMPREDFFYGYSVPQILEQFQEEQAQIHNHRRDANTIANNPGWIMKRGASVPNPASEWYPGRVFPVENMDDVAPLQFQGGYNAMIDEEQFLLQLADRTTGMGAPMQAMGSGILEGKRGVYSAQGTMAMLQAGSDRPDLFLKEYRETYHRIARHVYRYNRDLRTSPLPYQLWGQYGQILQIIMSYPEPDDYDPVYFSIGASDGSANREVDRTNLLLMSNTLAGYYNQLWQGVASLQQIPPNSPLYQTLLMVLNSGKDLIDRVLFAFDIGDRKKLIPDIQSVLGGGGGQAVPGPMETQQTGMPSPEGALPVTGLQALSSSIAQLSGGGAGAA